MNNDPLNEKQDIGRRISKYCMNLAVVIFITVLIGSQFIPEQTAKVVEPKEDFDNQDTINRNGNTYDIENDRIVKGNPIQLEKEI